MAPVVEERHAEVGGLTVRWSAAVLEPRPWTAAQGEWAAELLAVAPPGPVLELCCGAGHIGLVASVRSGRALVQVDVDPAAAALARENASAHGVEADVREAELRRGLGADERFDVVVADPPWVHTADVGAFPEDPVRAIDGGDDGLAMIHECLDVGIRHLSPGGHLLLQVGHPDQVAATRRWLALNEPRRAVLEVRDHRPGGLLVDVGPAEVR